MAEPPVAERLSIFYTMKTQQIDLFCTGIANYINYNSENQVCNSYLVKLPSGNSKMHKDIATVTTAL